MTEQAEFLTLIKPVYQHEDKVTSGRLKRVLLLAITEINQDKDLDSIALALGPVIRDELNQKTSADTSELQTLIHYCRKRAIRYSRKAARQGGRPTLPLF